MKNIHIRKQTGILLCILFALALSACTSKNITEPVEPAKQTFGAAPIQKSEEAEAVIGIPVRRNRRRQPVLRTMDTCWL